MLEHPRYGNSMNILSFDSSVELKDSIIRTSALQDDQLYLGCADGVLYIYDIAIPNDTEEDDDVPVLTFCKKLKLVDHSIDDMDILCDVGYLILLSNGLIHVFTLSDFQLEEKLSHFKNSNLFKIFSNMKENTQGTYSDIIDQSYTEKNSLMEYSDSMSLATANSTNLMEVAMATKDPEFVQDYRSYIAICCKRKLTVYTFIKDEFSSKLEYNLNDKVKTLEFLSSEKLLIGLKNNDLNLIDLYNSDPQSSITKLSTLPYISSSVVNSSSTFSYFRNTSSKLSIVRTLPHINIISKESLALKVNNNGEFLHYKKNSTKKNPLHWNKPPSLIRYWFPYLLLAQENNIIEIRRIRTGQIQQSIKIGDQIRAIEHHGNFLFVATDHSIEIWSRASFMDQLQQAKQLSKYEDAISLIEKLQPAIFHSDDDEADVMSDKDIKFSILRDFKVKYGKELFEKGEIDKAVDLFTTFMAPPDLVIKLFPKEIFGDDVIDLSSFEDASSSDEMPPMSPMSPTRNSPRRSTNSPSKKRQKNHVQKLVTSLIPYLTDTRRKLNKLLNPDSPKFEWKGVTIDKNLYFLSPEDHRDEQLNHMISLVDTTLFRSYLLSSPRLIGPLLRVNNYCNVEVVEKNLKLNSMFKELIDFYYAKELHDKALELLQSLGSTNETFHGPLPTIQYLQKLNDDNIQLIFKYLEWPMSIDVEFCKDVFLNDSIENESLNRFKVLTFLERTVDDNINIIKEYLEHLIYELNDETTKFHNKLIEIYLTNGDVVNLERLLNESESFDFTKALKLIDEASNEKFLIAKTIILSKLNEHEQILDIFVDDLQNYNAAVSYCLEIYGKDAGKGEELLTFLLAKYFQNVGTRVEALNLLATQGLKLNFINVLTNLPSDLSISQVKDFIITNLKDSEIKLTRSSFDKNLISLAKIKLQQRDLKLKNSRVLVDEDSVCQVCNKRLGYSVLSWFPDDVVVHYGCSKKLLT